MLRTIIGELSLGEFRLSTREIELPLADLRSTPEQCVTNTKMVVRP